jgi:hypothetical protein
MQVGRYGNKPAKTYQWQNHSKVQSNESAKYFKKCHDIFRATFNYQHLPFWNLDTNHNVNQHDLDFMTCGIENNYSPICIDCES